MSAQSTATVTIAINTTANVAGAQAATAAVTAATAATNPWTTASRNAGAAVVQTTRSLNSMEVELKQLLTQLRQMDVSSAAFGQVRDRAAALHGEIQALGRAQEVVGKSSSNAGRGVLELSRAFEDAQYGMAGVLNNIPGIITMFGGGAGLAGVISVAAVAASVLSKRLDGANFDGTWIGDLKTAITEMVDGMSEEEKRLRTLAEEPLSWIKNTEEAFAAQETAAERALNKEIELLKLRRDLIKETIDLRAAEVAHQAKLDKINRIDRPKGTAEWAQDQQKENQNTLATKEAERVAALDKAEQKKLAADEDAKNATAAAEAQRNRAKELGQTAELSNKLAAAAEADALKLAGEAKQAEGISGFTAPSPELPNLVKRQKDKEAEAKRLREKAQTGGSLVPGETVKGAEAKADELELKAQEQQLKKAREAQEFAAAKEASRKAAEINQAEFKAAQGDVQSEVFGKAAKDQDEATKRAEEKRLGKDREKGQLPKTDVAPKPVSMEDQLAAANDGLKDAARGTGDDAAKMKLGAMSSALMDGKGNTEAELAAIQEMLSNLGTSRSENQAALKTALQQMEALQKDGSTMQQALSGALSGLVQNQQELVAYVRSLQGQIEQIRTTVQNQ